MTDREVINMIIKLYLSNATEPHQATLNNELTNRLNDIADKLDKYNNISDNKENKIDSDTKISDSYLNKQMWEMNYINACLYFYVVRNTHNQKYSIQYRTTRHFDFTQSKYEIVKELPGIRFNKYESFEKRYWEYYEKYCVEHNKSISNK